MESCNRRSHSFICVLLRSHLHLFHSVLSKYFTGQRLSSRLWQVALSVARYCSFGSEWPFVQAGVEVIATRLFASSEDEDEDEHEHENENEDEDEEQA